MIDNFIAIGQSLGKFQLIESFLKVILVHHQLQQDKLNEKLNELYSVHSLVDIPYGILLKRYKKVCSDQSLYQRLLVLKDYRNYLAHQAFIAGLKSIPKDMKHFIGINPIVIDYVELNSELDACIELAVKNYQIVFGG